MLLQSWPLWPYLIINFNYLNWLRHNDPRLYLKVLLILTHQRHHTILRLYSYFRLHHLRCLRVLQLLLSKSVVIRRIQA